MTELVQQDPGLTRKPGPEQKLGFRQGLRVSEQGWREGAEPELQGLGQLPLFRWKQEREQEVVPNLLLVEAQDHHSLWLRRAEDRRRHRIEVDKLPTPNRRPSAPQALTDVGLHRAGTRPWKSWMLRRDYSTGWKSQWYENHRPQHFRRISGLDWRVYHRRGTLKNTQWSFW